MLCAVYIMANRPRGTLYIGVTRDLVNRVWEHKTEKYEGFTRRYGCHRLVWYEVVPLLTAAINREKQMKCWHRDWKIKLVERTNPEWRDLYADII